MSSEFKLVPVEPTEEMLSAVWSAMHANSHKTAASCYSAMLAAAPQPPTIGGEPEATAWVISDEYGTIDATVRWDMAKHSFGDVIPLISKAAHRAHLAMLQAEIDHLKAELAWQETDNQMQAAEIAQLKARRDELEGLIRELPYDLRELSGSENTAGVEACVEYLEQIAIAALSKPAGSEKV